MLYRKSGFNLSEVLIVLVIIGVIAAITIPSLMNNMNEEQYKSALKKNYSVISNAIKLAYGYDYDDFTDWNYVHSPNFTKEVYGKLSKYLYVEKVCGTTNRNECWADKTYAKNGQYGVYFQNSGKYSGGSETFGFILNDGTSIFIDIWAESTMNGLGISKKLILPEASLGFWLDINGSKGPNTIGKDIHAMALTKRGIVPAGIDNESRNCNNRNTNNNFDCTAKMLKS